MDYTIISVESRKGGVGKTTAALNLSNLLIEKNYNILLLDVDITGTSIEGSYNSSFWKDKINPIKQNNKDVNLLDVFHNTFMKGDPLPRFSIDGKQNDFNFLRDKINIFNSEIYGHDSSLICDPRILFDELHSFWLIEMIESLCNSFYKTMNEKANEKVAIILDNSPGYVGLGKAIHNWLTDIGPQYGKFLTVSSLDVQDLRSCISGIQTIDKIVQQKITGAEYYNILKNDNKQIPPKLSKESNKFFLKLATKDSEGQKYEYYKKEEIEKPDLSCYQSLIINKAPKEIKSSNLIYDFIEVLNNNPEKIKTLKVFTSGEINTSKKNIIYYDNSIHFQFVAQLIKRTKENGKYSSLNKAFNVIEKKTTENKHFFYNKKFLELHSEVSYLEFINNIENYDKALSSLVVQIKNSGLENIVSSIEERWFPLSQLNKMKQSFNNLCEEFYDYQPYSKFSENYIYDFNEGFTSTEEILNNIDNSDELDSYNIGNVFYIGTLFSFLLQKKRINLHSVINKEFILNISKLILIIQNTRFKGNNYKQNKEYQYFLANEDILPKTSRMELINLNSFSNYAGKNLSPEIINFFIQSNSFAEFYNLFCRSQARLIDIDDDFMFLISVLRIVTVDDTKDDLPIFPNIKHILDDVIIKKSKHAASAKDDIIKELKRAQEMTMFREVLTECVIKKWKL